MRIVIDTNVLLSAFLWGGAPRLLIERVREGAAELVISAALLEEFDRVIRRGKFATVLHRTTHTPANILEQLQILAEVIAAPPLPQPVCRDPKDDIVLACALAAAARLVVTGDDDLLSLKSHENISIVGVTQAIELLAAEQ